MSTSQPISTVDEIYEPDSSGIFFSPFHLEVDPILRLLLVNFERDPDPVYLGLEAQLFDDPVNGQGLLVLGGRRDGRVDVFHQPGLRLGHKNFNIVGKGLAGQVERPLAGSHFEIGPQGANLQFAFEDTQGRLIEVCIRERCRKPRRPFSLLAPLGSGSENPPSLPLILLYGFDFVRRAGAEVEIKIAGKTHRPDALPLPVDGASRFFSRYSPDPFLLTWNPACEGPLQPLQPGGAGEFVDRGNVYDLVRNGGCFEISGLRPADPRHAVQFRFNPPFPAVASLLDGAQKSGEFQVSFEPSMGELSGVWSARRTGGRVEIEVHPSGGWRPGVRKASVRLMFFMVPLFKNWPKTYLWKAEIDLSAPGLPWMKAGWSRLPPVRK